MNTFKMLDSFPINIDYIFMTKKKQTSFFKKCFEKCNDKVMSCSSLKAKYNRRNSTNSLEWNGIKILMFLLPEISDKIPKCNKKKKNK